MCFTTESVPVVEPLDEPGGVDGEGLGTASAFVLGAVGGTTGAAGALGDGVAAGVEDGAGSGDGAADGAGAGSAAGVADGEGSGVGVVEAVGADAAGEEAGTASSAFAGAVKPVIASASTMAGAAMRAVQPVRRKGVRARFSVDSSSKWAELC
ncbi:hypothetical protein [Leifsonia poae]|uniref:hypothetical protein n=1 Tax=Leifsonia poae TaxID=110933 RepID=UPI001CBB5022|nr:hypothetical protein [Leifsonia poae]